MRCGPARRNGRSRGCAVEIPEAMQKKYGFAPLGVAHGPVKTAIFGGNNARLYNVNPKKAMLDFKGDRLTQMKAEYEKEGPARSNMLSLRALRSTGNPFFAAWKIGRPMRPRM